MRFEEIYHHLPQDPHLKGKKFESLAKWWLANDELWSSLLKQVWHWNEWPKRTTRDLGIDLVGEGIDGTLWAIQCKAYDPESHLKKSDIDSFLSASSQPQFSNRLLITTTKSIGENARNTIAHQEKPVQVVDWIRLNESSVDWAFAETGIQSKPHQPRTLRPHQNEALQAVIEGFAEADRGQLIMACGTGKTLTGLRINEEMKSELTIVLVPSLTLLSQTLKDWLVDRTVNFKWLAVCSDDSVTNDPQDNARLVDYDIPATTDRRVIEQFLGTAGTKVIFSTYQSSEILKFAVLSAKSEVGLVISDEAHRLTGKVGREFASFLDPDLPVKKRLFMTATPRIYGNSQKTRFENKDLQIISMDDKEVFGEVFHRYSFSRAISDGILSDYRVVVIGIDDRAVQDLFSKRTLVQAGVVETDSESLALHIALAKAMKTWSLRRVISFHSRVAKARKFANDQLHLNQWMPKEYAVEGKLNATTISSSMPTNKRRRILDELKNLDEGETTLVSNARCLTEGIDVPTLDAVVFVDPKSSQVDIIQAIGRAIRIGSDNKTHGTVVVPVYVPTGKSTRDAFDTSNYKKIGDVLTALRAHDEDFGEILDKVRTSLGERGSMGEMPEKLIWDLPVNISQDLVEQIKVVSIEFATSSWDFMFGLLQDFVAKEGHARPSAHDSDRNNLGKWVGTQRRNYKSGHLSEKRKLALEGIHHTWTWDPINDVWDSNFQLLKDFVKLHGHARPSHNDESGLGRWVTNQRIAFKSGKLSRHRISALDSIPTWTWDQIDDKWNLMFELLRKYEELHGHTNVIHKAQLDGFALGHWVGAQRVKYHKKGTRIGTLTSEQISKLESLSTWTWNPRNDKFEMYLLEIERFREICGHTQVPDEYKTGNLNLGKWVRSLRTKYKAGKLTPESIDRIESRFPDWSWGIFQDSWAKTFAILEKFIEMNGHANVHKDVVLDDKKLGQWVHQQKNHFKKGKLIQERIKKLENSHPTWTWNLLEQRWEEFFALLHEFKRVHGHCNVGSKGKTKEERALHEWVNTQRKSFKSGNLEEDRRVRLASIGFLFEPVNRWMESYAKLKLYVERNGSAKVPIRYKEDGYSLGGWVTRQRKLYKKKQLNAEQIELLERLVGWEWEPLSTEKK